MAQEHIQEGGIGLHGDEEHVELGYIVLPVGMAQGATLYFDGTEWTYLGAGTSGYYLKTQGPAANPVWAAVASGDSFPANPETGDLVTYDGAAWQNLHHGANGNVLKSQGHGALPIWGSVSGTVPDGSARGDIMWWNGSGWTLLAAGNDMETLHIYVDENGKNVMWIADNYVSNMGTEVGDTMWYNGTYWAVIHHGTSGQFLKTNGHGAAPSWGDVGMPSGTEQGDVLYWTGAAWADLAHGTSSQFLKSGGHGANPSWDTPATGFPSSPEQGDIIYFNGTNFVDLSHGTDGQLLKTGGHAANPSWVSVSGTVADGTEQGDCLYWNGAAWVVLAHGVNGQAFCTGGHGANPSWQSLSGTVPAGSEQGDVMYWSGSAWVNLTHGTASQYLKSGGHAANPTWGDLPSQLPAGPATGDTIYFNGSSWVLLAAGAANKILTAHGAAAPTWETPSASGSTFTPIASSAWQVQSYGSNLRGTRFAGVINGAPSATSVVYDGDSNEADCPTGGRFMLYNTTRSTWRIVTAHNKGTNTFTTVSSTDSWADNDNIRCDLYDTGDSLATYMAIDVSDVVPSGATAILLGVRSQLKYSESGHLWIHPFTTYSEPLNYVHNVVGAVATISTSSCDVTVKNYSQRFCLDWNAPANTSNTFYISVKGYWT
jgi:hypothetical protein